jgi:hypothetical protein
MVYSLLFQEAKPAKIGSDVAEEEDRWAVKDVIKLTRQTTMPVSYYDIPMA